MIVHAYGGLCNRLRVVLSYRAAGVSEFRWDADGEIAGAHFGDVFRPLRGVSFVTGGADLRTCDPCPSAPDGWQAAYRELTLIPCHLAAFQRLAATRPFGAMHVRRGDHVDYAKSLGTFTPDDEFVTWLQSAPERVYLATDTAKSQRAAEAWIMSANRTPIVHSDIASHPEEDVGGRRNTDLHIAALDLFACASADSFKGTRESSFSDTVRMLRAMKGWWST